MRNHLLIGEMMRLSMRNFRINPVRSMLTVLGMSVGFGVVLFLVSLGYGLQYILIGNLVTTQDSLVTMQASYPSEAKIYFTKESLADISKMPDVAEISPVGTFSGEATKKDSVSPALVSMDVVEPNYFRLSGLQPTLGKIFSSTTEGVVVTSQTLALMSMSTSSTSLSLPISVIADYEDDVHGTTTTAKSRELLPILGIISDDTQAPLIYLPSEALETAPTFYQTVLVKAKTVDDVDHVRDELTNKGLVVSARIDLVNQARQITNIITIVLGVFGITALFVSAIGMFNTMVVSFMERTYEVGILKSLGATDHDVRNLFLIESAVMGFMGGTGGIAMGFIASQIINFGLSALAQHYGGKAFTLFITPLWFMGLTVGLSILIGIISGIWPAMRASRLSPKEAFLRK